MLSLRDALLNSLKSLPGSREFHIHTIVSAPRKTYDLFPYASPRPRAWIQDIAVLVSEQANTDAPRVFVTAVEAYLYTIPVTTSGILYVSKVDSTGQGKRPSPTSTIVKSLICYYLDSETRPSIGGGVEKIWVHVFARAQNQYLFPNSSEHGGKKPLSDIRLCGWWKAILSAVATDLKQKVCEEGTLKLWYTLPGLTDLEAFRALNSVSGPSTSRPITYEISWNYGHPYSQATSADHSDVIQLPCPVDSKKDGRQNLGNFIPSFEDDPKSRFLDEIAHTSESDAIRSPVRKKSKKGLNEDAGEKKKEVHEFAELVRVTPDEFWERMSFRQECVAGVVTGFFVLAYSTRSKQNVDSASTTSSVSIFAPQPYHVSSNITKRVLTSLITGHEFSTVERAIRGTETLEGAIKGLCEGINSHETGPLPAQDRGRKTPDPADRPSLLDLPPRTPPRNVKAKGLPAEVSPNPFPEPVASLETYYSWIYGSVYVDNPMASVESVRTDAGSAGAPVPKEQKVTVLTARKKKRILE